MIKSLEPQRLVFLDEVGFALNLHRLYGWLIGGGRLFERVPFQKGHNRSCVGAFSLPSEANPTGLWTLWQRVGTWTGTLFTLFVEDAVLPLLPPGSVLVVDNARIHHGDALKRAVQEAGCQLVFLPAYSPDFNPIELLWSWLKHLVRTLGPRTDEERTDAIRQALLLLPAEHAPHWFHKCGIL